MTTGEVSQFMMGLGLLTTGIGTILTYMQSFKNGTKIEAIHVATDGMKDALVKVTGESEYAKGLKQGGEDFFKKSQS